MRQGAFIVFSSLKDGECRRLPLPGSTSSTRDAELQLSFVRSHVAHVKHAKFRHRLGSRRVERLRRDSGGLHRPEPNPSPVTMRPSESYRFGERVMLQWYLQHTCFVRGTGDSLARTFWEELIPQMSWDDEGLRKAFLVQIAAMKVYTDSWWELPDYRRSLEYQNSAVQQLTTKSTDIRTLLVAAAMFSVASMYCNDWSQAYRHALAGLELSNTLGSEVLQDLRLTLSYVRQLFEDIVEAYCTIGGITPSSLSDPFGQNELVKDGSRAATSSCHCERRNAAAHTPSQASDLNIQDPVCAKSQLEMFFDFSMAVVATQHNLLFILKTLKAPSSRSSYLILSQEGLVASTIEFAELTLVKAAWLYDRWTSGTYQGDYLTKTQRRQLCDLKTCLQTYASSQLPYDIYGAELTRIVSSIPLFRDINAFAIFLSGSEQVSPDNACHNCGSSIKSRGRRVGTAVKIPTLSLRHFSWLCVPIVAGQDARLRQDVWEWNAST